MARIMGIDYGKKRIGLAVTDPLQIIVSPLETIQNEEILIYLKKYLDEEKIEKIVIGYPTHKDGTPTQLVKDIEQFALKLNTLFPCIKVDYQDEYLSSHHAKEIIIKSGVKYQKRKDKSLVDTVSAVLILQQYLGHI